MTTAPSARAAFINLPNKLTIARVAMVPVFVLLLSMHQWVCYLLAYAVFTAATITDYWDGKIARERNLVTNFGKLIDPVADKVLLAAAFVMLMMLPSGATPWDACCSSSSCVSGKNAATNGPSG